MPQGQADEASNLGPHDGGLQALQGMDAEQQVGEALVRIQHPVGLQIQELLEEGPKGLRLVCSA